MHNLYFTLYESNTYRRFEGASFFCFLFITAGTQLVSSVQSACRPQLQPVEKREKSHDSALPGRWHVHFFCPERQSHGRSRRMLRTRCLPNVVPPVFWMCRNTITSSPLMSKSTWRSRSWRVKLNLDHNPSGDSLLTSAGCLENGKLSPFPNRQDVLPAGQMY